MSDYISIKPHKYCLFCYLKNSKKEPPEITWDHLKTHHANLDLHSLDGYHLLVDTLVVNDRLGFIPQPQHIFNCDKAVESFDAPVAAVVKQIMQTISSVVIHKNGSDPLTKATLIRELLDKHLEKAVKRQPPESERENTKLNVFGYYEKLFDNNHTMIWIPTSRFSGTGETIPGFWLDKYPVTNRQYMKEMKTRKLIQETRNHPVVNVDWYDVNAYCEKVGLRLPNEVEWEQAVTAGDGRWFPWGGPFDPKKCNVHESGIGDVCPVNQHPLGASPYGVMDTVGNVWEWCLPHATIKSAWMILRGGAWNSTSSSAHCNTRLRTLPSVKNQNVGFRCAKSPE